MDATQDCILGVLSGQQYGLKYQGVEAYADSIRRSGFRGRKILLVWNINPVVRIFLTQAGFELVDVPTPVEPGFFHARVRLAKEYLEQHWEEFRYVFWLDIKDLVVQTNPSIWMEENIRDNKIVAACECVTIEQEETNRLWAIDVLGDYRYQKIKNCEVINGGTWAGTSKAVTWLFEEVHRITQVYAGGYPPCQPAINYVMHTFFKNELYIPRWEEGFAACLHPFWSWCARHQCRPYIRDLAPVLDSRTRLLHPGQRINPTNRQIAFGREKLEFESANWGPLAGVELVQRPKYAPFSIVHGYDRDWQVREFMENRYSAESTVEAWAQQKSLGLTEVGRPDFIKSGYSVVSVQDLWLLESDSIGILRAIDSLQKWVDTKLTLRQVYRVLAPNGWAVIQVPSTDGRGAYQDPTNKSFWNINTFQNLEGFLIAELYDTAPDQEQVVWTHAKLIKV